MTRTNRDKKLKELFEYFRKYVQNLKVYSSYNMIFHFCFIYKSYYALHTKNSAILCNTPYSIGVMKCCYIKISLYILFIAIYFTKKKENVHET